MRSAAHVQLGDVRRIDRHRDGARHQAVEVDPDRLDRTKLDRPRRLVRRVIFLFLLIVLAGLRLLLMLGFVRLRRRRVVRGAAALVGLRCDRRGRIACQRDRVDSRRFEDREIEVDVRADRILMPARDEIEILSIGRPGGICIDSAAVTDSRQFAGGNFVEHEVAPAVDRRQAQREPAPVRRKCLIMDFGEFILRDLLRRSAVGADDPEPVGAIRESQHFPIGREDRRIKVALGE